MTPTDSSAPLNNRFFTNVNDFRAILTGGQGDG